MATVRRCSRAACGRPAVATLTYVYADSTAVVGPLAAYAEPHSYDLCPGHAATLTGPLGWEVVRLDDDLETGPTRDELEALADAVREAGFAPAAPADPAAPGRNGAPSAATPAAGQPAQGRRGHLRVLPTP